MGKKVWTVSHFLDIFLLIRWSFESVARLFPFLPPCAVVGNKIFCASGGLSPSAPLLQDITLVDRRSDQENEGILVDLRISSPEDVESWQMVTTFVLSLIAQVPKGYGFYFGINNTKKFLKDNKLSDMIVSNSLVTHGHMRMHDNLVNVIFSASDYTGRCNNYGAFIKIGEDLELTPCCYKINTRDPSLNIRVVENK